MSYQPHANRVLSDISWLESIPAHWDIKRLRFVVKTNPVKSEVKLKAEDLVSFVPMDAVGEYGGLRLDLEKELGDVYTGYTYFRSRDILVAKITPCFENGKGAIALELTNDVGFGTTELHVLRASDEITPEYIFYVTISHSFREIGASEMLGAGGQKRISEEFIKDFRFPIPSLDEQHKIVAFLEHKTAQIDALIEKKRALIEKLNEKRTAVITQAVTKGLDPNVPMKDSGVAWLGEVPAHWEVKRLKYMLDIENGRDYQHIESDDGYPVIGSGGQFAYASEYMYDGEAILFGRKGTIDKPLYVNGKFWTVDTMFYSIVHDGIDPNFMYYNALTIQFQRLATQTALPSITQHDLENYVLCLPPSDEQLLIVRRINADANKILKLIDCAENTIKSLREYRQTIISAAVTGQIDVRDFSAA